MYKMVGGHRFSLVAKRRIQIDTALRRPQKVAVVPPLPIKQGQFVGIVNKDGKLRLTCVRALAVDAVGLLGVVGGQVAAGVRETGKI